MNLSNITSNCEYYNSIKDIPLIKWVEIHEKNNLLPLVKSGNIDSRCQEVYEKLQDEFLNIFGISNEYAKALRLKIQIALLENRMLCKGENALGLQIKTLESQLKTLEVPKSKTEVFDSIIGIEKHMGFKVNYQTITVYEFYKYAEHIKKIVSESKQNGK